MLYKIRAAGKKGAAWDMSQKMFSLLPVVMVLFSTFLISSSRVSEQGWKCPSGTRSGRPRASTGCPAGTETTTLYYGLKPGQDVAAENSMTFKWDSGAALDRGGRQVCGTTNFREGTPTDPYPAISVPRGRRDPDNIAKSLENRKVVKIWGYAYGAMCSGHGPKFRLETGPANSPKVLRSVYGDSGFTIQPHCTDWSGSNTENAAWGKRAIKRKYSGKSIDPENRHADYGRCEHGLACHRSPDFETEVEDDEDGLDAWSPL